MDEAKTGKTQFLGIIESLPTNIRILLTGTPIQNRLREYYNMVSLVAPYTAEDMWARLGHEPSVARAGWPDVDESLLVEDSVTCVVQVAGKVKDRLDVSPSIAEDELRDLALASDAVAAALDGRAVKTTIVRPPKLVNIVPE